MPWLSMGLVVVLGLVFLAEIRWPVSAPDRSLQPSVTTLVAFGGLSWALVVEQGQWFRLAAAPFLHGSPMHLLFNSLALILAGRSLEGYVGRSWFAAIYVIGALAGGAGSMLVNPATTVSVGASGAIVALFAAMCVCSLHLPRSTARSRLQSRAIAILLPTLLSLGKTGDGLTIDFGAHLGGALGGALMGLWLLRGWSQDEERPPRRRLGLAISTAGALGAAVAVWPVMTGYPRFERGARIIPVAALPKSDEDFVKQAPELLKRFPGDPRVHTAMAIRLLAAGDGPGAEVQARQGLADPAFLHEAFDHRAEASLWMELGRALALQKEAAAALDAYGKSIAVDGTIPGAYYLRASIEGEQGAFDPGLRDAKRYVELSPNAAAGWSLEGDLFFEKLDFAQAIAAYQSAFRLEPTELVMRVRGLARFFNGDREGGIVDLQNSVLQAPQDLYAALWLDIDLQRFGLKPRMSDETLRQAGSVWPAPVVSLFIGTITPKELSALAVSGGVRPSDQMCEADFYIAEWNRIHDSLGAAGDGLRKAAQECPSAFVESWMARAELNGDLVP